MKMIRITSKKDGFRRCGLPHSKTPVDYPLNRFDDNKLAELKAESMLVVQEIEADDQGVKQDDQKTKAKAQKSADPQKEKQD